MTDFETKVKIGADTSGLKEVRREATAAFSPRPIKEMRQETMGLKSDLGRLNAELAINIQRMRDVERGSKAYKDLRKDIRGIKDEAQLVSSALKSINDEMGKAAQKRQSFVAGLAQGSGLAQYMPTGAGMGRRMAGAAIGGAARRGVGGAAAPFMSPGLGGLATMLQALPGGGAAAGALQSAASMYQEAVGFQRARLENLQYMGNIGGRMAAARSAAAGAARGRGGRKGLVGEGAMSEAMMAARSGMSAIDPFGNLQTESQFELTGMKSQTAEPDALAEGKALAPAFARIFMGDSALKRQGDRVDRARSRQRDIGASIPARLSKFAEMERQRVSRAAGAAFGPVELPTAGAGASLGYTAEATQQMFGQFMQARGGVAGKEGGGLANRQAAEQRVLQRRFGIGAGLAGGYARGMEAGGGNAGGNTLTQTIASGFAMGLRGSQLVEYTQTLVDLSRKAEQQGVKINGDEFSKSSMMLRAVGIEGLQGQRIAGGLNQGAMALGGRGVQNGLDMMQMKAFGYDPAGGFESYAKANLAAMGGHTSTTMEKMLGMAVQGTSGMGGGASHQFLLSRTLGKLGAPVGDPKMLQSLISGFPGGKMSEEGRATLAEMMGKGGAGSRSLKLGQIFSDTRSVSGKIGGAAVQEAGMQAERIGAGGQWGGLMKATHDANMAAVGALSHFSGALTKVSGAVTKLFNALDSLIEGIDKVKTD